MVEQGYRADDVAQALGVSQRSVNRWHKAWREQGDEGLASKPNHGRPSRLSARQQDQLTKLLLKGPQKAGFPNDLWTCSRVAQVIERHFGVSYDHSHVWRLLQSLGWSCQTPQQSPRQQEQTAVERWTKDDLPRIKKGTPRSS